MNERLWIGLGILLVLIITAADVVEDLGRDQGPIMILGDLVYMGAMLGFLIYLWRSLPLSLKKANVMLTQEVVKRHKDAESWQQRAAEVIRGFSHLISKQFEQWQLTDAEKDVGVLLLKGLSIKEISVIRGTSDGTVRQQATSLYTKAGLASRAELSAFFLEDLWIVDDEHSTQ